MSKVKKQKRTLSQIKYDEEHPTVSFRIDKELYDLLMRIKEKEGKSIADVLRIGAGILKVKIEEESKIKKAAYDEGFRTGYKQAEDKYKITFPCHVCKQPIVISIQSGKKEITRYLIQSQWGHSECIQDETGDELIDGIANAIKLLDKKGI